MTLDNLPQVKWHALQTASGTADGVPAALRGLMSPDERKRIESYWQLDNKIVLQSDLYESAYYVVPFLLGMLSDGKAPSDRIYELLCQIAYGYAPENVTCQTFDGIVMPLKAACILELQKGISVFERDARCEQCSPDVQSCAAELLDELTPN